MKRKNPLGEGQGAGLKSAVPRQKELGYSLREDTHNLRLTSELVDLRLGYANPFLRLRSGTECERISSAAKRKEKNDHRMMVVFLLSRDYEKDIF